MTEQEAAALKSCVEREFNANGVKYGGIRLSKRWDVVGRCWAWTVSIEVCNNPPRHGASTIICDNMATEKEVSVWVKDLLGKE